MNLVGQKFGRWTVIEYSHSVNRKPYWLCECECGTIKSVRQESLRSGRSTSCGCYHNEKAKSIGIRSLKHGDFGTHLYGVWAGMKRRCQNAHTKYYSYYGGRGITVCKDWQDYINFKEWAFSTGYHEGLSLERQDVNGNYCPKNCIWIPLSEQNKNKRNTIYVKYNGRDYTIKEIAEITGLKERTIKGRYERGWSSEQIFSTTLKKNQY